ncbi:MAG TPA: hypothetical protein VJ623_11405 [Holophagaceae bacterium]|nr:hypothetical protein [Holophagaceae bacterium]
MPSLVLGATLCLAQGPKDWKPALAPGESLGLGGAREGINVYGEATRPHPLGFVAKLVWLRMQGTEWEARGFRARCTGSLDGLACSNPKGHGRVDLGKALREGCDLGFLVWARASVADWSQESGEGSARLRLEEGFRSFLGRRLPAGDGPPVLGLEWVGQGTLLQGSVREILDWMLEPAQEGLAQQARRYFGNLTQDPIGDWWVAAGASVGMGETGTWVCGSNGSTYALLHLPRTLPKTEAVARFKSLLSLK